jgi:hypothetical protein
VHAAKGPAIRAVMESPPAARASAWVVVVAWTRAGVVNGLRIGVGYGTLAGLILAGPYGASIGLPFGVLAGPVAGFAVGFLDGLVLAWLRPVRHPSIAAVAVTELILLPFQVWLWFQIHYLIIFLVVVALPSVVSVGVAALLGRRLPPGAGSRTA